MRRFIIVLFFTAGCAALRTPEPANPAAALQSPPARPVEKIEQPAIQEKTAEPAPPVAAEPSHPAAPKKLSLVRREPSTNPLQKPEKPSLSLKEEPVPDHKLQSLTKLAAANDEKILKVYTGMYRKTVEGIMGTAQNPYKRQKITGADGKVYEVLFYLTQEPRKGRPITDRMLAPIIFRKDQVVAIGNYNLKKLIRTGTVGRKKTAKGTLGPSS